MDKIASGSTEDRKALFEEVGARKGLSPTIIEKDFWVCWTLKHVFALPVAPHLMFKGGTSLSKVFGAIERFSEDIDLSVHRDFLGFGGENEPERQASVKKRDKAIEALQTACETFIADKFRPMLESSFEAVLGKQGASWSLAIDESDKQTLHFSYPTGLNKGDNSYVLPNVKLEMGARSDPYPTGAYSVKPYAADIFPNFFEAPNCPVNVLEIERTFWEKATILHAEHHRPAASRMPGRLSRHYSDLAALTNGGIAEKALSRLDLLERVAQHKAVFFKSAWAKYDEAKPGALHLLPNEARMPELIRDYAAMHEMFFGQPPTFDSILETLSGLERRINGFAE